MAAEYKRGQSCGMPMKRDEMGGGSDTVGGRSNMYCSYCYAQGQFVLADIKAEQMRASVKDKPREFGMPGFPTGFMSRAIPKLESWRSG